MSLIVNKETKLSAEHWNVEVIAHAKEDILPGTNLGSIGGNLIYGKAMEANKVNLPLIKKMLDQVSEDASVLAMDREELMEEFMIAYQDTLLEIGLDNREIARMAMAAIV